MAMYTSFKTVDEYIKSSPSEVQPKLAKIRRIIQKEAPKAEEKMSYGMPGYKLGRPLVYFAAFKSHIGFFPAPSGVSEFKKELKDYPTGKGTIRFPMDKPIPYDLVRKIVKFRVKENNELLKNRNKSVNSKSNK